MKVPAFAWRTQDTAKSRHLKNTEAWQAVRAFGSARQQLTEIKKTAALQHLKVCESPGRRQANKLFFRS